MTKEAREFPPSQNGQSVALAGIDMAAGPDTTVWVVLCTTISGGEIHRMVGGVFSTEQRARDYMAKCLPHVDAEIDSLEVDVERD